MGITNKHMIRHKAKGAGKKWRPSPNDPAFVPPRQRAERTTWFDSVRDVFSRWKATAVTAGGLA